MTSVKAPYEIEAMRVGGKMLASVLDHLQKELSPGMTTKDLAEIAKRELRTMGGQPAFLGYQGFPDVLCVSLNNEVVHGIPSAKRVIEEGDIVSLDFGVRYKGMITDGAISAVAGRATNPKVGKLIETTKQALLSGIDTLQDGVAVGDIAAAVQKVLDKHDYGIVRDLVGHGVGHNLHEEPNIPNYGQKGSGPHLKAGMTIAIEPMATLGDYRVYVADDGWTVLTSDSTLSAHFEHTVLITTDGAEILTRL
jgi:methionyl aminopeptidase